jgi:lipoate-protein ligase A
MHIIGLNTTDPFFNLAVDEYLLKNSKEEYLVLGINDVCAVVGKHQVSHRETDTRFVHEHNIPVIRRISGGGTVFHDNGNLNFSFILNSREGKQVDFRKYTKPVIEFLSSAGIPAEFEGRNDLKVGGLKISGNAEHVFRNRVLHHGTLLFDSDLNLLKGALRKDAGKYETRAVASNPSSVTNIKTLLESLTERPGNIYDFKSKMADWFGRNYKDSEKGILTDQDNRNIEALANSKYRTWEWNYAYGPVYTFYNTFTFNEQNIRCELTVRNGKISECLIEGNPVLSALSRKLVGEPHMVYDLKEILRNEGLIDSGFDIFDFF